MKTAALILVLFLFSDSTGSDSSSDKHPMCGEWWTNAKGELNSWFGDPDQGWVCLCQMLNNPCGLKKIHSLGILYRTIHFYYEGEEIKVRSLKEFSIQDKCSGLLKNLENNTS